MGDERRKKQSWPIFMPGHSLIGSVATFESSSVTWPEKPGSMKPAVEWVSSPSRPSEDLPSRRAAMSSGRRDQLEGAAEHELARVQDERLVGGRLDQVRQLGLVLGRVDERVLVVVEQPEVAVEAHVDARGLHHLGLPRLEPDPASRRSRVGCRGLRAARGQPSGAVVSARFVMLAGRLRGLPGM